MFILTSHKLKHPDHQKICSCGERSMFLWHIPDGTHLQSALLVLLWDFEGSFWVLTVVALVRFLEAVSNTCSLFIILHTNMVNNRKFTRARNFQWVT